MKLALCKLNDVPEGGGRTVEAGGRRFAVIRLDGEIFALDGVCPHKGGPIADGRVSAKLFEVSCPWHRYPYDLRTGACRIDKRFRVACYPVKIEDGEVSVTLEAGAKRRGEGGGESE